MQTFLPYADFRKSAQCLDRARLGKQRVEALQLIRALRGETKGWVNHPACKMWREHTNALCVYLYVCIEEWTRRGYANTIVVPMTVGPAHLPMWFGDERLHASHRSNLLRKDPVYYGRFGWTEPPDLPYFWPTQEGAL